jgi:hypothetical protein
VTTLLGGSIVSGVRRLLPVFGIAAAAASAGCGGGPPPAAFENRTFYQYDDLIATGGNASERPYPPLDQKARPGLPEYIGVSILGGTVHLSRPSNWKIRRLSMAPERRYIEYVSPNEYLFAIYERTDSAIDPWREVLERYEEDAKASGAELLGARIPVATGNAQGREYVVRRRIKGQKAPYTNLSREVVLRSEHRVDVVEIVHQGETPAGISDELLRVMETLELR